MKIFTLKILNNFETRIETSKSHHRTFSDVINKMMMMTINVTDKQTLFVIIIFWISVVQNECFFQFWFVRILLLYFFQQRIHCSKKIFCIENKNIQEKNQIYLHQHSPNLVTLIERDLNNNLQMKKKKSKLMRNF